MDLSQLDEDAVRATQRLINQGYEAYLVGGCVRDLLLGREPKDYDIATEARPQQVKRVFPRNCRIIGRRFKLAHLHFHGNTKILECSTFRRTPQQGENGDDVLITRDNEFGNAEEDALRRDFTVNALFLDPTRDTILDYTNGLPDLQARVIRTIGDPRVRFREDPVRILRAAKFAGRLGFAVEPETFAAMCETSGDLVRSAPPRLFEEILRLLRGGHSIDSFQLLRDVGALKSLVPVLADFLADAEHDQRVDFWRLLQALDHHIQDGRRPQNGVLLGALMLLPVLTKVERNPGRSPSSIAEELLSPFCAALRLPRRDAGCVKRICGVQHRFVQNDDEKRFRTEGFLHGPYFLEALELFELRARANDYDLALVDRWKDLADDVFRDGPRDDRPLDDDDAPAPIADDEIADRGPRSATEAGDDGADEAEAPAAVDEVDGEQPVSDAVAADQPPSPNPWEQPDQPGRRRRRRRRRRGGRRDDEFAPADGATESSPPTAAGPDNEAPVPSGTGFDASDELDAPPSLRARHVVPDFVNPEGIEDDIDVDVEAASRDAASEPGAATAPGDAATPEAADRDLGPEGLGPEGLGPESLGPEGTAGDRPGRPRRRRRRRRRGGGQPFPPSDAPAPHGEAVDATGAPHEPLADGTIVPDPSAPERENDDDTEPGPQADDVVGSAATAEASSLGADVAAGEGDGDRRGRRRRRRRRGRGRHRDGDQPEGMNADDAGAELQGPMLPQAERPAPPRPAQPPQHRPQQQRRPQPPRQHQHQQRQHAPQQRRDDRQPRPQQEGQHDRGGRRERHRDRDRNRGGRGAPRDVDVVPRHRDRRGEVDVIEPTALDLSAFDVELDPKRVPTFGSIVEGKGRPKRRGPRVPDDRADDYRPPPPPGSDPGPAPPPPPLDEPPDTFGDW